MQIIYGLILAIITAFVAYRARSLNICGAVAATIVGTTVFGLGGLSWAILLMVFFITSSGLSRMFKKRKQGLEEKFSKGHQRDAGQVFGNGGLATAFVLVHALYPESSIGWVGFAAALAAVNADTWATELGVLNPTQPRISTDFRKRVERGTSGGISLSGTLASLMGSAVVALPAAEDAAELDYEHCLLELQKVHAAGQQLLALINTSLAPARVAAGHFDTTEFHRDCRTLLNLITGYTGLCEEYAAERAQQSLKDDLRRIQTAASNPLSLLKDDKVFEPLTRARPIPSPVPLARPSGKGAKTSPGEVSTLEIPNLVGTVLVVHDDEMNRDMLSRRLERQGHKVILAEDGRRALAVLKTHSVDLILLDILMPELDGLETLEQLKTDETLRHTPVIMLSALDEIDRVVRCIEVGADDYLAKPFNPVLLKARINASRRS